MLTAFSWGYGGWGNSVPQLIEAYDAVEKSRGFKPPIFVDVRARREVRALGFRGDAFGKTLSEIGGRSAVKRHHWLQGLGNKTKVDPESPPALIEPKEIYKLLDIVQAARNDGRRVLFFCSDPSPFKYYGCHRKIVAEMLRRVSRKKGEPVTVEEWPGGKAAKKPISIQITKKAMDRVLTQGGQRIDLGERMPPVELLALPHGSLVQYTDGTRQVVSSASCAVVHAKRWGLPLCLQPVLESDTMDSLWPDVLRWRREILLEGVTVELPADHDPLKWK